MTALRCVTWTGLLLAGLPLGTCVEGVTANQVAKTVTVTEKENDGKIKVGKGDTLVLKLPQQGGTGFTWVLAKNDKDKLKQVGKEETEKPAKPLPGGKVTRVFRFNATVAGTSELELHYKRPFEKDKATCFQDVQDHCDGGVVFLGHQIQSASKGGACQQPMAQMGLIGPIGPISPICPLRWGKKRHSTCKPL